MATLRTVQGRSDRLRDAIHEVTDSAGQEHRGIGNVTSDESAIIEQVSQDPDAQDSHHVTDTVGDARQVFVIHGRNLRARNAMFQFLRTVSLHPLTWEEVVRLTGRGGSPTTLEVVRAGLAAASAIVVLLTPDELVAELVAPNGDSERGMQPRPNVILEAGMALAIAPQRTLLVRLGQTREISDVSGINFITMRNGPAERMRLLMRLEAAGAKPVTNEDMVNPAVAGDFDNMAR